MLYIINKKCFKIFFHMVKIVFKKISEMALMFLIVFIVLGGFNRSILVKSYEIYGFIVEGYSADSVLNYDEFTPNFEVDAIVNFRIYGNLTGLEMVGLTLKENLEDSNNCSVIESTISDVNLHSNIVGTLQMVMPSGKTRYATYIFCFNDGSHWVAPTEVNTWSELVVMKPYFKKFASILMIVFCVLLSSILNGLALGLMTIDITGLKVIANAGSEREKRYGRAILSVRSKGNYLLISLVIGSTLCNSFMTVLIDLYMSNIITVILSTILVVLFCEILPCTIVPRYNLIIGANTIYLTKFFMLITFPVSYPLGKLLDKLLGEDFNMYTKERIKELVKITTKFTNIKKLEADTIAGALEISAKKVEDVMTPISDMYMLPIETHLDYSVISEIMRSGYSRIPIYDGDRNNIVKVLHVRDLALLDPDDNTSIRLFCQLIKTECIYVDEGSALDEVFNIFKEGTKGHMAFVRKPSGDGHNVIGLLTLEDVIEELIQVEIVDESDSIVDNRSKRKRDRTRLVADYLTAFADKFETKNVFISPHLRLATFQFLASEIDAFKPDVISPKVLRRLLYLGVIVHMYGKKRTVTIFSQDKASEGFVMIIEGRALIILGPDNLKFECGPFSYFGLLCLDPSASLQNKYDYTVESAGEIRFLKIPPDLYLAAKRATVAENNGEEGDLSKELYPALFSDQDPAEQTNRANERNASH